jgi:hypothetical protein
VFHLDQDRPIPLISKAFVDELGRTRRGSLPFEDAAILLGITYHGVEQLVCLGRLEQITISATRSGADELRVSENSLRALIEAIGTSCMPKGTAELIPLATVFDGTRGEKPWGPILQALSQSRLPCSVETGPAPLLDRIQVRAIDQSRLRVMAFRRDDHPDFCFCTTMSKKDAASALNLHFRNAIPLLGQWPSDPRVERTVPIQEVERLAAAYVSPREMAVRLTLSATGIVREAKMAGLERKSLAGFDRAEVDRWLSINESGPPHDSSES